MARLPDATSLGQRPTPQPSMAVQTYDGTRAAQSAARFGATVAQAGLDMLERRDKLAYAAAKSKLLQEDMRIRQELEADPDFETYGERYEKAMSAARDAAIKDMGANFFRNELAIDAGNIMTAGAMNVSGMAQQRRADRGVATLNEVLDGNRSAALTAQDEATRAALIDAANDAIDGAVASGFISETKAGDLRRGFAESYALGQVQMMPPQSRLNALRNVTPGSPLSFIQPDKRFALMEQTERELLAERRARQAEYNEYLRRRGDEMLREAYARADQGTLTPDFVEANRQFFSPSEYKGLLKSLRGDEAVDDARAIADLTLRLDSASPEEFERDATNYLLSNQITTGTYRTMISQARSAYSDRTPANPYKSGREIVKTALEPGQLFDSVQAAMARQAQTEALEEYDAWTRANPEVDHAATSAKARDIIRRAQAIPFDRMKGSMGLSPYFTASDRGSVTLEDVARAESRLVADIDAGRLTKEQAEVEARRLNQWREILEREARAKTAGNNNGQ